MSFRVIEAKRGAGGRESSKRNVDLRITKARSGKNKNGEQKYNVVFYVSKGVMRRLRWKIGDKALFQFGEDEDDGFVSWTRVPHDTEGAYTISSPKGLKARGTTTAATISISSGEVCDRIFPNGVYHLIPEFELDDDGSLLVDYTSNGEESE